MFMAIFVSSLELVLGVVLGLPRVFTTGTASSTELNYCPLRVDFILKFKLTQFFELISRKYNKFLSSSFPDTNIYLVLCTIN